VVVFVYYETSVFMDVGLLSFSIPYTCEWYLQNDWQVITAQLMIKQKWSNKWIVILFLLWTEQKLYNSLFMSLKWAYHNLKWLWLNIVWGFAILLVQYSIQLRTEKINKIRIWTNWIIVLDCLQQLKWCSYVCFNVTLMPMQCCTLLFGQLCGTTLLLILKKHKLCNS